MTYCSCFQHYKLAFLLIIQQNIQAFYREQKELLCNRSYVFSMNQVSLSLLHSTFVQKILKFSSVLKDKISTRKENSHKQFSTIQASFSTHRSKYLGFFLGSKMSSSVTEIMFFNKPGQFIAAACYTFTKILKFSSVSSKKNLTRKRKQQ